MGKVSLGLNSYDFLYYNISTKKKNIAVYRYKLFTRPKCFFNFTSKLYSYLIIKFITKPEKFTLPICIFIHFFNLLFLDYSLLFFVRVSY